MTNTQDQIHICIASDNNYAPLIATTIASVCFNTNRQVKFWCLESDISNYNKKLIDSLHIKFKNFDIEYKKIDRAMITEFASKIQTSKYISADTYSRMFIPELFPDVEKMIYLDIDLVALGDVGELYDTDLGDCLIGAVSEQDNTPQADILQNMQFSPEHCYFNAGVLLMNPAKMRRDNFMGKISEILNKYAQYIRLGDQDLLNKYAECNYVKLPARFNMMSLLMAECDIVKNTNVANYIQTECRNIVIRHYESQCKPWLTTKFWRDNLTLKTLAEFWTFAAMTPYLTWFERQFQIKQLQCQGGRIENIELPQNWHNFRLMGLIPIWSVHKHGHKTKYMLFDLVPLLTTKEKNNGRKKVWRLLDTVTLLTTKK